MIPAYFLLQTALPAVLVLTYPASQLLSPLGARTASSGMAGVLEPENYYTALLPIGVMFVTAAANLAFFGPQTTKVMKERKHQETRDGKRYYEPGPHSKEMQALSRKFGQLHGVSTIVNMIGLGFMLRYGFLLSERMQ